ncbi:TRAP transporter small permease [Shewanella insulae]|uniref:TRAP transporter small permease n=1 Tax=Shewanella insulae TaxID=2681496 RepID=UPI001EFEC41B|nr:TRAP transporter small permease [Shewanella insulae]MCG9714217.1 TRAP transporter small permease [Shewanella insulae]MCG9754972.1 TRAP transporter small permease [Shewanella insulae]
MMSRFFSHIEEVVLNALITAMTLLVFVEVIARFFFNTGFLWIQELTLTICGWFVLFGMSYGVKIGAHIGVDAFVKKLPAKGRKYTALLAVAICLVYCGMFLVGSWDYLAKMYQIGVPMEDIDFPHFLVSGLDPDKAWEYLRIDVEEPAVPLWISQSILLIGFSLLTWRFLQLALAIITNKTDGFAFADEAKESMHLIDQEAQADDKQPGDQK